MLLSFLVLALAERDFYAILGVGRRAGAAELKKAYHKKSVANHPDRCTEAERAACTSRFQDITRAYEVLSDDEKRRVYDQGGEEALVNFESNNNPNHQQALFNNWHGGTQPKGQATVVELSLPLETLYTGKSQSTLVRHKVKCPHCHGTGADSDADYPKCDNCNGRGVVIERHDLGNGYYQQYQHSCWKCGGEGRIIKKRCRVCHAATVKVVEDYVFLEVPPGAPDGHQLIFEGMGDQVLDFRYLPGDLIYILRERKHPRFTRENTIHLRHKLTINLYEAFFGFNRTIVHLDGRLVPISRTGVTQPGETIRIPGEGMPRLNDIHGAHGDLFIDVTVVIPTLDNVKGATLKDFKEILGRVVSK